HLFQQKRQSIQKTGCTPSTACSILQDGFGRNRKDKMQEKLRSYSLFSGFSSVFSSASGWSLEATTSIFGASDGSSSIETTSGLTFGWVRTAGFGMRLMSQTRPIKPEETITWGAEASAN